jgi:hypothetical protein
MVQYQSFDVYVVMDLNFAIKFSLFKIFNKKSAVLGSVYLTKF